MPQRYINHHMHTSTVSSFSSKTRMISTKQDKREMLYLWNVSKWFVQDPWSHGPRTSIYSFFYVIGTLANSSDTPPKSFCDALICKRGNIFHWCDQSPCNYNLQVRGLFPQLQSNGDYIARTLS